jgi:hypothetical protein
VAQPAAAFAQCIHHAPVAGLEELAELRRTAERPVAPGHVFPPGKEINPDVGRQSFNATTAYKPPPAKLILGMDVSL